MTTRPIVRVFLACWNGVPGTPVDQHRLCDATNIVRPTAGDRYPLRHPELCFYALLTGGRGLNEFVIQQRFGVGSSGRVVWQSRPLAVDLGDDPLRLLGFPIRFRDLIFPDPGQYEFLLLCGGMELQALFIEARE